MGTLARNRLRIKRYTTEAVVWRCSSKQLLLKSSQNSQENTCARVFFNSIKKETLVQVFSCKFCEIFIYRTPPDDCFLLFESVKTSQQFPGNVFLSFESRLTFYWKRHYSICIPKNWNILTWFVCHSTEYLKLKWIDRRHFLGKRSVVILKIIYFLFKWFLEFSDLASTVTKKQSSS